MRPIRGCDSPKKKTWYFGLSKPFSNLYMSPPATLNKLEKTPTNTWYFGTVVIFDKYWYLKTIESKKFKFESQKFNFILIVLFIIIVFWKFWDHCDILRRRTKIRMKLRYRVCLRVILLRKCVIINDSTQKLRAQYRSVVGIQVFEMVSTVTLIAKDILKYGYMRHFTKN